MKAGNRSITRCNRAERVSDALHAYKVLGVRQQAGFIICYGPRRAITQPWNDASAVNVHFSVTKSSLCLLPQTEVSVSSTFILFSADRLNNTTGFQRGKT